MAEQNDLLRNRLRQAHAKLGEDLRRLEQDLGPSSGIAELRECLAKTQQDVSEHFRIEEEGGYMDTVRESEPRLVTRVDQLAREHRELLGTLDGLVRTAEAASSPDLVRAQAAEWLERLREHEQAEHELIQDAFNEDLGGRG